jgi:ubiquinone/menaquinone biosynthesis C-methylase UbiE/DNA-binding CsgD family transcriptional regulator
MRFCEREILGLIAVGKSNAEIAEELVLSSKTVNNHVSNIFSKLQVVDRAQAALRAWQAGLGLFESERRASVMSQSDSQQTLPSSQEDRKNSLVQERFGAAARAYSTSNVHASGPDLAWVVEAAALEGEERVVDVGTGTGHTALALAPYAREVIAVDITLPMLEEAQGLAAGRGLTNLRFLQADASSLPLAGGQFDLVTCRQAAHHFSKIAQAVHEWARILKTGGKVVVVDSVSPEEPEIDSFLHEIEVLRDPSHVRNYRISEWFALLADAGFTASLSRSWTIPLDIPSWTKRIRTEPASVAQIEQLFAGASPAIKERLRIGLSEEGLLSFALPAAVFVGVK